MPRLYIGNLPRRVEERDIKKFFREYGRIRSVDIKNGYGFVEMDDRRDAEDAIHDLDGAKLLGERVTVEMARSNARFGGGGERGSGGGDRGGRGYDSRSNNRYDSRDSRDRYNSRKPIRSEHRIIVDDLSSRVSWQDLKDLMRKVGEVTFADAHKLRPNQGVVEFSNSSDMRSAIDKYDGFELYGYKLRVYEDRGGGVSKRRSRSRSRSSYRRRSSSRSKRSFSRSTRSRSKSSNKRSRSRRRSTSRKRSTSKKSRSVKSSKSKSPAQKWVGEEEPKSASRSRSRSFDKGKDDSVKSRSKSMSKEKERSLSRSASPSKSRSNSPCDRESLKSAGSDTEQPEADNETSAVTNDNMDSN